VFGGIFHNFFFFVCFLSLSLFSTTVAPTLHPPSFSHQSVGRTVQTISEYKLSLNLLQEELFSWIFIFILLAFMHWLISKRE